MKAEKIERYIKQGGRWVKHEFKETDIEKLHSYGDIDGIRLVSEIVTENGRLVAKIVGWYRPTLSAEWEDGYNAGYSDGKKRGYLHACELNGIRIEF